MALLYFYDSPLLFLEPLQCKVFYAGGPFLQAERGPPSVLVSTPPPPGSAINLDWSKPVLDSFPLTRDWLTGRHVTQLWPMRHEGRSAGGCKRTSGKRVLGLLK